jgi:hypothetical protein
MSGFCCTRFRVLQCHWSHLLPTYAPTDHTPAGYWFGRLTGFGVYTGEGGRERRAQIVKKSRSHLAILAARRVTLQQVTY